MKKSLPGYDSRQIMRRQDYEIAHKQDAYLKDVALHHHDFYEVYFLISGDITYIIDGRTYHLIPGDMLVINPHELHQVFIKPDMSPYERYVLWIAPWLIEKLSTENTDLCYCFHPEYPGYSNHLHLPSALRSVVLTLVDTLDRATQEGGFGEDILPYSLLSTLMILVNRIAQQGGRQYPDADPSNHTVLQVIDYINLHYSEEITLSLLAERFFVNKYHLSHIFQQHIGTSPYQYLLRRRLLVARQLMRQGQKPTEIYTQCGFADYACFYRAFRRIYSMSPREYVRQLTLQ